MRSDNTQTANQGPQLVSRVTPTINMRASLYDNGSIMVREFETRIAFTAEEFAAIAEMVAKATEA